MPVTLIFATNNDNKVREIQSMLDDRIHIVTMSAAGFNIDIPEPHATLEANAREKAHTIYRLSGQNCFGEDTGLEVAALNGAPGVLSARYAGEQKLAADNIKKLLDELSGHPQRKARFRTLISLVWEGQDHLFEGACEGTITTIPAGSKGFGYDPVFIPDGAVKTFAQMDTAEKNAYSHRAKAVRKLVKFLQTV